MLVVAVVLHITLAIQALADQVLAVMGQTLLLAHHQVMVRLIVVVAVAQAVILMAAQVVQV
jgi:hypothetical protein